MVKMKQFENIVKIGRTHLQDATPLLIISIGNNLLESLFFSLILAVFSCPT